MKMLDLGYIQYFKYLTLTTIVAVIGLVALLGVPLGNFTIIGSIIGVVYIFVKKSLDTKIALKELRRRIYQLPVVRDNEFIWSRHQNMGIFFVDRQRDVFWYCGTQSRFEVIAMPLSDVIIRESFDRIIIEHEGWGTELVVFKI